MIPPRNPRTLLYTPLRLDHSLMHRRVVRKLSMLGTRSKRKAATLTPFRDLVEASSRFLKMLGCITSTPRGTTSTSRATKARSISTDRKTILISGTTASGTPTICSTSSSPSRMAYRESETEPHDVDGRPVSAAISPLPKKSLSRDTCLGPMHRVSRSLPGVWTPSL